MMLNPVWQIAAGVLLMVASIVLSFLMMLRLLAPSLALGFLAFWLTMIGMAVGIVGALQYIRLDKNRKDRDRDPSRRDSQP